MSRSLATLLPLKCLAERVVEPSEAREVFCIVQQIHDARLFFQR